MCSQNEITLEKFLLYILRFHDNLHLILTRNLCMDRCYEGKPEKMSYLNNLHIFC